MILYAASRNNPNMPSFTHTAVKPLISNKTKRDKLKISYISRRVNPDNPNYPRIFPRTKGIQVYNNEWKVLIRFVDDKEDNTPENGKKWALGLVRYFNKCSEKYYTHKTTYEFGGDLTPLNEPVYLGDVIPTADVMDVIQKSYSDEKEQHLLTQQQILESNDILEHYFGRDRIQQVRDSYSVAVGNNDGNAIKDEYDSDGSEFNVMNDL